MNARGDWDAVLAGVRDLLNGAGGPPSACQPTPRLEPVRCASPRSLTQSVDCGSYHYVGIHSSIGQAEEVTG